MVVRDFQSELGFVMIYRIIRKYNYNNFLDLLMSKEKELDPIEEIEEVEQVEQNEESDYEDEPKQFKSRRHKGYYNV